MKVRTDFLSTFSIIFRVLYFAQCINCVSYVGEKIRMGDTVVLESVKMQKMFLHVDMEQDEREIAEVNFFDRATRFRVVPVSKFEEVEKAEANDGICGGGFVEIYRRQSSSYIYRDYLTNVPCLLAVDLNPEGSENDAIPVAKLRADLLFQLNMPSMAWSGEAMLCDERSTQVFSVRDAISGKFMCEQNGEVQFTDRDESKSALWTLCPFEALEETGDEPEKLEAEQSQFWLQNCVTGNRLCQGVDSDDGDELCPLACREPQAVAEADLFVLRSVPHAWMDKFFQLMQGTAVLKTFYEDIKNIAPSQDYDRRKQAMKILCKNHFMQYMVKSRPKGDATFVIDGPGSLDGPTTRPYWMKNITTSSNR